MPDDVLVSCLTVTLPSLARLEPLKRSIAAYRGQTHGARELVIVLDQGPPEAKAAIRAHVAALGRDDVRLVEPEGELPLGALRNLSLASARGEVCCQWDDDDLHHPERIADQLAALSASGAQAVCLQEAMQFFPATRTLYWTNWRATEATVLPGTLMCRASAPIRYPERGETARLGEDSDVCTQLQRMAGLHALAGAPHLYVYLSHGDNTWDDGHHRMLADRLGISPGLLRRREALIRERLRAFDFGPGAVSVRGPGGGAFIIDDPSGEVVQP